MTVVVATVVLAVVAGMSVLVVPSVGDSVVMEAEILESFDDTIFLNSYRALSRIISEGQIILLASLRIVIGVI